MRRARGGRPVTVAGTRQVNIRVSEETMRQLLDLRARLRSEGREARSSEVWRLGLRLLLEQPIEVLQAALEGEDGVSFEVAEDPRTQPALVRGREGGGRRRRGGEAAV